MMVISEELTQIIKISRYRKGVLEELAQGIKSPRELEIQLNIRLNHISRTLTQLIELKLVKCLTPKLGRNRLFTITKKGKSVVRKIRRENKGKSHDRSKKATNRKKLIMAIT